MRVGTRGGAKLSTPASGGIVVAMATRSYEQDQLRYAQTVCQLILAGTAVALALYWLESVLVPVVLALLLAVALAPLINFLHKRCRFPRWLALVAAIVVSAAALGGLGLIIIEAVDQLAVNASIYEAELRRRATLALENLPWEHFGVHPDDAIRAGTSTFFEGAGSAMLNITNSLLGLISRGALVLIFLLFMLASDPRRFGQSDFLDVVQHHVRHYIITKTWLSIATGVCTGVSLALLGVDLALVFGLFAFLLNFIPSVGSTIATLLPLPVVLVSPDLTLTTQVLAFVIPGFFQFFIGNVIETKLLGSSMHLHPVVVMMSLIVWSVIWGVVGMFLAVPLTAIIRLLAEQSVLTRPVARWLAGDFVRVSIGPPEP